MPLIIRAKMWLDGTPEPGWQIERTDPDPLPGATSGIWLYRGGTGEAVADYRFDDYTLHNSRGRLLGKDTFSREVARNWESAETGGAWTFSGGLPGKGLVTGGKGVLRIPPANGGDATLNGVPTATSRAHFVFTPTSSPEDGTVYAGVISRASGGNSYRGAAYLRPDGAVWTVLQRNGATLGFYILPSTTWAAGQTWHLRSETIDPDERPAFAWIGQRAITRALISGQEIKP